MLSAVFGEEGIDFSEPAGLVAVCSGPFLPFGQIFVEAVAALADELERRLAPGFGSDSPVESFFGSLAVVTSGEAPVTAESCECFLGGFSFSTGSGEVGERVLLVSLESRHGVEGSSGGLFDDGCQLQAFGPERVDGARGRTTG